jgi:hypothetical protein
VGQLLQLDGYTTDPDGILNEPITSWVNPPSALPSQTSNSEKVLATDGSNPYWTIEGLKTGYPTDTTVLGRAIPGTLTGTKNILVGPSSGGASLTTGSGNVCIGYDAITLSNGSNGVVIGNEARGGAGESVAIGYQAYCAANQNTAIGYQARAENARSTAIGRGAQATANGDNLAIGQFARVTGANSIHIGSYGQATTVSVSNAIGLNGAATVANSTLLGRTTSLYFNNMGAQRQFTAALSENQIFANTYVTGGSVNDADASGGIFTINAARGTGTGIGGDIRFRTAPPGLVSNNVQNALVEQVRITYDGKVGIGTSTPGEKLEVAGAVLATEYRVPNYRLDPHTHDEGTETGNFTINWANGAVHTVTLNAAGPLVVTMNNPVNGGAYALRIIQGATPGTVTWPANVKWPGGTPPTLSSSTGDIDIVNFLYFDDGGGNTFYYGTIAQDFA